MKTLDEAMAQEWTKNYPRAIQIETNSRCNSGCVYCPYVATSKKFGHNFMSDELFEKIVAELADFEPQLVTPYLNNEPFVDKKIIEKIRHIRASLPNTFIDFSTNGTIMTKEKSYQLLDPSLGINEIKINIPSTDDEEYKQLTGHNFQKTLRNITDFVEARYKLGYDGRVRIIMVGSENPERETEFWDKVGVDSKVYQKVSRGGLIETEMSPKLEVNGCKYNRDKEWMHVLSNGDVILCCMDWDRQHILGNVADNSSIYDIWNSTPYQEVRQKVNGSTNVEFICNQCEWGLEPYRKD